MFHGVNHDAGLRVQEYEPYVGVRGLNPTKGLLVELGLWEDTLS